MTDLQALKAFEEDISCLDSLDEYINEVNFFEITGITNLEIKHSNFLAWLFDANGSHKLGDSVIKRFLELVFEKNPDKTAKINYSELDFHNFIVRREKEHLDIFLCSFKDKVTITIENKVWSPERKGQTEEYRIKINEHYRSFKNCFIFLTPDDVKAQDNQYWYHASYVDIINSIEKALNNNPTVNKSEVGIFVRHYLKAIRRNILMDDKDIKDKCEEIYKKHKAALDLLFNYRPKELPDTNMQVRNLLIEFFSDNNNQKQYGIIFDEDSMCDPTIIRFFTERLEKILPKEGKKYEFLNEYMFLYEITLDEDWNQLLVEGVISDQEDERIKKLFDISNKMDKAISGKSRKTQFKTWGRTFKRVLFDSKLSDCNFEDIKDDINKKLICIIKDLIPKYENAVLDEWNK